MAAFRETAAGAFELYPNRLKAWLTLLGAVVLALVSAVIVISDHSQYMGWIGLVLFGLGSIVLASKWGWQGLVAGRPLVVLDRDGVRDRTTGFDVRWDEVESAEIREQYASGTTQRYLSLEVKDPDVVIGRLGGFGQAAAQLQLPGWPTVNIPLNMLRASSRQVVELVARFYRGPIDVPDELEPDAPRVRGSRLRRFALWLRDWVIAFAIVVAVGLLIVWLR